MEPQDPLEGNLGSSFVSHVSFGFPLLTQKQPFKYLPISQQGLDPFNSLYLSTSVVYEGSLGQQGRKHGIFFNYLIVCYRLTALAANRWWKTHARLMSGCCSKHLSSIIQRKVGTTFSLLSGRDQQHLARTSGTPLQHLASQTPGNPSADLPHVIPSLKKHLLNKLFIAF